MKAYFAAEGFEKELAHEVLKLKRQHGRLFLSEHPQADPVWAQNIWLQPEIISISSVAQAVQELRRRGRHWAHYTHGDSRWAYEIEQQVPTAKQKPIHFLAALPKDQMGAWTLLDSRQLLLSRQTSSPFINGEVHFSEDKRPPNRAYLKLWELFTVHGIEPKPGARCLDLGATPGGWTWVLQTMGCQVLAVDKAPLAPTIAKLKGVEFLKEDAFGLRPEAIGPIDWLFSDIVCYPQRLLELAQMWRESGMVQNFVCTIKFQGTTDFAMLKKFQAIPGSKAIHLSHNKHEVTWVLLKKT
ncbi:MAG: SAM-dependent methyltransferase [Bdellovibrionales bacterium]